MKKIFSFLIAIISFSAIAQKDTIQVMQYNLLNYGNYWNDCTTNTNNVNTKNIHLRTIIDHVKPDIFTVNELSETTSYHQMILDQVLNTNGDNHYRKAVSFNYAESFLVNMLYYNGNKLSLYSQDVVHSAVRDIDVFTLYYNASDLAQTHDTIFITCFVAHLKAGNSSSDASKRAGMVSTAMTYIRTHQLPDNMLFMGDFNVYTHQEQAYINLLYNYNGTQYFYDPIDRPGKWNNNYDYRDVHTQSTHANNTACFSHGGMDDRFDFILASGSLLEGSDKMKLLTNTYEALGNDGEHYNKSLTDSPTNTSAPSPVIDALYNMSDHLPILSKIQVDATLGLGENITAITAIKFQNPSSSNLQLTVNVKVPQSIKLEIYDVYGRLVFTKQYSNFGNSLSADISMHKLADGPYVLTLTDENGNKASRKFILKK